MQLLNEKLDVLDRIAVNTRQKISAARDKIVQSADAERDRSFILLAQMIEEEKQQVRNKNKQLNELPLNEISTFIRKLKSDVQHLTDKNDRLFNINIMAPQIILQRQDEQHNRFVMERKRSSLETRSSLDTRSSHDEDESSLGRKSETSLPRSTDEVRTKYGEVRAKFGEVREKNEEGRGIMVKYE
jgi:hypothetical protein